MYVSCVLQGLKVIDLQQSDYMRTLESAIQFGLPVLLQNVQEKLDPSLDPILNKSLMKIGTENNFGLYVFFLLPCAIQELLVDTEKIDLRRSRV